MKNSYHFSIYPYHIHLGMGGSVCVSATALLMPWFLEIRKKIFRGLASFELSQRNFLSLFGEWVCIGCLNLCLIPSHSSVKRFTPLFPVTQMEWADSLSFVNVSHLFWYLQCTELSVTISKQTSPWNLKKFYQKDLK